MIIVKIILVMAKLKQLGCSAEPGGSGGFPLFKGAEYPAIRIPSG